MVSLALSLQLLGAVPSPAPDLHLVPRLALALEQPASPDLAPRSPPEPPGPGVPQETVAGPTSRERHVGLGAAMGAAGGIVIADLAALAVLKSAGVPLLQSHGSYSGPATVSPVLAVAGVASAVFVTPAVGILGARLAGERGDAGGRAYWLAFACRLAGAAATAHFIREKVPSAAAATGLATELVLQPYLIAWALAGAPPRADALDPVPADARLERYPPPSPTR